MKNYREILEGKNNSLYHLVGFDQMKFILDNNKLSSRTVPNISTTDNKSLNWYLGGPPIIFGKLELNKKKLESKYKIEPFEFISNTNIKFKENEQLILTNEIKNIWKYVTKFIFIKENIEKDFQFLANRINIIRDEIIPNIKAPIYVQSKKSIKKNNKQLKEWGFI